MTLRSSLFFNFAFLIFLALPTLAGNSSRKGRKEIKNAKNSLANFVPLRPLRENPVLLRRALKIKKGHDFAKLPIF